MAKPIYETLPGWQSEVSDLRSIDDLPANARAYLDRLSELVGPPVEVVSFGADREQTMFAGEMRAVGWAERGEAHAQNVK